MSSYIHIGLPIIRMLCVKVKILSFLMSVRDSHLRVDKTLALVFLKGEIVWQLLAIFMYIV